VFGGNEKLKDTIENALKVIDADLYVVLTGYKEGITCVTTEKIRMLLPEGISFGF